MTAPLHRLGTTTSYHVVKSGWSLRVQKPAGAGSRGDDPDATQVVHREVTCTLADDGLVLGSGRYEVSPRMGPFLGIELPAGATLLWVSLNGTPVRPANDGPGRWQIPLAADSFGRVALLWRSDPIAGTTTTAPIPLPIVGRGRVPTVVTVRAPSGVELFSPYGRVASTSLERIEIEKASWLERGTAGSLEGLDRASHRDGENLVAVPRPTRASPPTRRARAGSRPSAHRRERALAVRRANQPSGSARR